MLWWWEEESERVVIEDSNLTDYSLVNGGEEGEEMIVL